MTIKYKYMKKNCVRFQYLCLPLMLLAVMSLFSLNVSAQKLTAESMEYLPNDASAASYETQMEYDTGLFAGIVKVYIALDGVEFEGGGVLKQEKRGMGEYWVWMAKDSSRLKVRAPGFLPLDVNFRSYEGVNIIHAKSTYKLVLTFAKEEREQMQKLTLRYAPADATVIIDDQVVEGTKGVIETQLPVGDHSYSIAKKGYGVDKGIFTLLSSTPKRLTVELEKLQDTSSVTTETTVNRPVSHPVQTVTPTVQPIQPATASSNQTNASNKTFEVNGVSFTMVYVEGGTFFMGTTSEQGSEVLANEKPAHSVTLSSYYIGETEVTQELWEAVMGKNPSKFTGDGRRPVEQVNWKDCQTFISKLNSLTGQQFKLPTEAQWEYAARGGNKTNGYKYSGSNDLEAVAWYEKNSYDKGSSSPDYGPHPVKTKSPNELGIYDMSGNVWEWCQDRYGSYSTDSQTNPVGVSSGSYRVGRGGGWSRAIWNPYRSSHRGICNPSNRNADFGLRLAL